MKTIPRKPERKLTSHKRRILIVDDHPLFRQGISQLISHEPDMIVCGEAETAAQALSEMERLEPDLAIVDVSLKGTNGIELVKSFRALRPNLPVLILSMHDESLYAERALRAGGRGYIMKQAPPEQVMDAIRRVLCGELYLSPEANRQLLHTLVSGRERGAGASSVEQLSDRELEVFELLGKGHGTVQIAHELNVSVKTVEAHRAHIKTKLSLRTAPELVRAAVEWVANEAQGRR